jgi:hypothetical protein
MEIKEPLPPVYGIMAEFDNADAVVAAAQKSYDAGYRKMDAYSPFPIEELSEAVGFHNTKLPLIIFLGAAVGMAFGYGLQYWVSVIEYPINIGGRPPNSWVAFIPITFECTVLFASFAAVIGMIALNGLPMPYHPVFNVPRFELASTDRFFLCIEATDPKFDREKTAEFLKSFHPREVTEVAH